MRLRAALLAGALSSLAAPTLAQSLEPARLDTQQCRLPNTAHRESPAWQQPLVLALDISAAGEITAARVRTSSGDAAFNERVIEAVRACRATPARRDGAPFDAVLTFQVRLRDSRQNLPRITVTAACAPEYPAEALRQERQGTTRLRFSVSAAGTVEGVELVDSSGFEALDLAAIASLRRCAFAPAKDNEGRPIAATLSVDYTWKLE